MRCPICAKAELVQDVRDLAHAYKGEVTTIPAVTGDFCPVCGEAILGMTEAARVSALMLEFNSSRPA